MRRFMDRLPDDVVFAVNDVGDDCRIFNFVLHLKQHPIPHGNGVGHFEPFYFEFALQPTLEDVAIFVPDIVPGTGRANN